MKTPEEIKKGLEGCKDKSNCEWCNLIDQCKRNADVLAYITQLEQRLAQAERERDAAVRELEIAEDCYNCKYNYACKHDGNGYRKCSECGECPCSKCEGGESQYEWRGICEENSK